MKADLPARRVRGHGDRGGKGNDEGDHEAGSEGDAAHTRPWKAGGDTAAFLVTLRGLSWETKTSQAEAAIRDKLTGTLEHDAIKIYRKGGLNTGYLTIRFPTYDAAAAGAGALHKMVIGRRWLEVVDAPGWEGAAAGPKQEAGGGTGSLPPGLPAPAAGSDGRTRATGCAAGPGSGGTPGGHAPVRGRGDGPSRGGRSAPAVGRDEHLGPRTTKGTGRRGESGQALSKREIRREGRRLARYLATIQDTTEALQSCTDRLVAAAIFSQRLRGKPPPRGDVRDSEDSGGGGSYSSYSDGDGELGH